MNMDEVEKDLKNFTDLLTDAAKGVTTGIKPDAEGAIRKAAELAGFEDVDKYIHAVKYYIDHASTLIRPASESLLAALPEKASSKAAVTCLFAMALITKDFVDHAESRSDDIKRRAKELGERFKRRADDLEAGRSPTE